MALDQGSISLFCRQCQALEVLRFGFGTLHNKANASSGNHRWRQLVTDGEARLPQGQRVEVEFRVVEDQGVDVDENTLPELEAAHREIDAGDFVSAEEVLAGLRSALVK